MQCTLWETAEIVWCTSRWCSDRETVMVHKRTDSIYSGMGWTVGVEG